MFLRIFVYFGEENEIMNDFEKKKFKRKLYKIWLNIYMLGFGIWLFYFEMGFENLLVFEGK